MIFVGNVFASCNPITEGSLADTTIQTIEGSNRILRAELWSLGIRWNYKVLYNLPNVGQNMRNCRRATGDIYATTLVLKDEASNTPICEAGIGAPISHASINVKVYYEEKPRGNSYIRVAKCDFFDKDGKEMAVNYFPGIIRSYD
jgi:hypothetical protein